MVYKRTNYGKKIDPPTIEIAKAFGSDVMPVLLKGGQGTSYSSGNIVLKPAGSSDGLERRADIFSKLPENPDVRFYRPIKSIHDTWDYLGYVAWTFLPGEHVKGHYDKKLKASIEFHKLLSGIKKADYLDVPNSSWAVADFVALDRKEFDYDQEFLDFYNQIKPHLKPLPVDRQPVHGDILGNFLVDDTLPPAVIDFSEAWAPNGFGEGIMLADAVAWENATPSEVEIFKTVPNIEQFAWRGVLRRITEQAEHIKWFGKSKTDAVESAREFQKVIDYLNNHF